ncbi:serine hydrolase domain-containing protein [Nonomuraea salmonea]|uniref:serine hydrolase domain-containing protein n=1 Tax=Nonomuraea salmonea TaxID=46181 RepID=UPI002FEC2C19
MANGFSEQGLLRLRDVLARHVDSGRIPGLVALASRGGQTHVEALGTMQHDGGAPMRRDTIFRMASTSKPVTIAAAMVLLDECRLRLDDVVDPWLPELADRKVLRSIGADLDDTVPARRPITVRDVLTSTFGLGMDMTALGTPILNAIFERGLTPNLPVEVPEQDEWMRRLGELPLMHQPGAQWQYQISSDLVGVLVSRVSGQTFGDFLHERVFEPLGMHDTAFHVPADQLDRLPTLYAPPTPPRASSSPGTSPRTAAGAALRRSRAAEAAWSPPPTTTTPTSACCSTAASTKAGASCRGPPSS